VLVRFRPGAPSTFIERKPAALPASDPNSRL
jgi:hypothetical protein